MNFTEYVEQMIPKAIKELKERDREDGEPIMTDEEYRLSIYEDLRDTLKYIFSDVAYG